MKMQQCFLKEGILALFKSIVTSMYIILINQAVYTDRLEEGIGSEAQGPFLTPFSYGNLKKI